MKYSKGWQVGLTGWRKYYRLFLIGWAVEHDHDPEAVDRKLYIRWNKNG